MLFGVGILCRIWYCLVRCLLFNCIYLQMNHVGWGRESIFSANIVVSVRRSLLFLSVLGKGCDIFMWHSLDLPLTIMDRRNIISLFVWFEALRPSQQFFSHVGTEPPLPGYYQYVLGGILLKDATRRPE